MQTALWMTGLLMGLAGSPHCATMCGAASATLGCSASRPVAFQLGRLGGYGLFGAVIASSSEALRWGARELVVLQPFWAMFHLAVVLLGLALLWLGRQPAWLDALAGRVWQGLRHRTLGLDSRRWPVVAGLLWALLPCGLLYSALMVASLASTPWEGGAVMVGFGLGSGVGLQLGPLLWRRLTTAGGPARAAAAGGWGIRVGGLALAASSAWALGHTLMTGPLAQFCA
ncbi:sulfite exporter TauE/SafE family protein [Aquabacterium sp. A7-Y]|uniref:sulfite exporter TauE/SafE family protein n=1 Tax=Aquabacterium sp. A7-Y TaxID=1349605 RepID=UPI00223D8C19|nr:sulfite exporter TauE/SafE family protein [Aquabacterium sp. A7-Y]MCW7537784.1 sulfite exporter TauE/SafE family protein [Aquabacterium sp. A7-Y]